LTDSTFTLEIGEQETEELPCNAGYQAVQDALQKLTNMGQVHVNRNDYSDYTLTTSTADIKIEWLVTFIHEIPSGSIDFKGFGNLNNLEIGTVAGFAASDFAIEEVQSGGVDRLDELPDQFVLLATQAPTAPTNVVLTVVSDDELGVSWSPPLHTGGEAIVQYLVEWDTEYTFDRPRVRTPFNENVVYSAIVNAATDPLQFLIQNLDADYTYFVRVSAWNGQTGALGYSAPMTSSPASATTAEQLPWKPVNVKMEVSRDNIASQIDLQWDHPVENLNNYVSASAGRGSTQDFNSYRIQWDTSEFFNSGAFGQPQGSTDVSEVDVCDQQPCKFSLGVEVQELRVYSSTHVELAAGEFRLQHASMLSGPAVTLCANCAEALSGNVVSFDSGADLSSLGTNAVFSILACDFVVNGVDATNHEIFVEGGHGCNDFTGMTHAILMDPVSACISMVSTASELETAFATYFGNAQLAVSRGSDDASATIDNDPGAGWFYRITFVGEDVAGDQAAFRVTSADGSASCTVPTDGANMKSEVKTISNGGVLTQGIPYHVRLAGVSDVSYPGAGETQIATPYLESGESLSKSFLVPRAEPLQPHVVHSYADVSDDSKVWVTWDAVVDDHGSAVLSYVVEYDIDDIVDTPIAGVVSGIDTDTNLVTINCDQACLDQIEKDVRFQVGDRECTMQVLVDHACTADQDCDISVVADHGCCPNTNWAESCSWTGIPAEFRLVTSTGLNYVAVSSSSTDQYTDAFHVHTYTVAIENLAPGSEYEIRVRAANDQGDSHEVTYAEPICQPGLEECYSDSGSLTGTILARELPHAPTVVVPDIGGLNGFTSSVLVVTFKDSAEWDQTRAIDKFKVEWDLLPSFSSNANLGKPESFDETRAEIGTAFTGTSPEVAATNTADGSLLYTYSIENLSPGLQYFIRVSGHNTLGYGDVSLLQVSIPRRSSDPVADTIALSQLPDDAAVEERTSSLQLDWTKPSNEGGSPVTSYLVEWGRAPWCVTVDGLQDNQGDCVTDRNMDRASFDVSTVCGVNCEVGGSFRLRLDTTNCEFCSVKTQEDSQNLRYDFTSEEMKTAIENMPNIGVVVVTRSDLESERNTASWVIEFASEVGDIPLFELLSDDLLLDSSSNGETATVSIAPVTTGTNPVHNDYCGGEDCVVVDVEDTSDTTFTYNLAGSPSSPLLAGQKYYARVSAGNALGYGPRRNAPPVTVPMDVPSGPTSYFHSGGVPGLTVTGPQTLLVSFGPPTYDGGDSLSAYRVEWDVVNSFTGSTTGSPLGHHVIDLADTKICEDCATILANNVLTVNLAPSELRQLDTGVRISVATFPDQGSSNCQFIVSDSAPLSNQIYVEDGHGCQDFDLTTSDCGATYTDPCDSTHYDITLLSVEYEIPGLDSGTPYFVRVFARNQDVGWGLPSYTSPNVLTPLEGATAEASSSLLTLSQGSVGGASLLAEWPEQSNVAGTQHPVIGYRVERYVQSSQAQEGTWAGVFGPIWSHVGGGQHFGVDEVQEIDVHGAQHGYFTVGYGAIDQELPGTLTCEAGLGTCITSHDLTAYLMRGDAVMIDGETYLVHSTKRFTAQSLPLAKADSWPNLEANAVLGTVDATFIGNTASGLSAFKQATTPRLSPSVSKVTLKTALENLPSIGAVKVERTGTFAIDDGTGAGYKWSVTFLTEVGDLDDLVINGRLLSDGVHDYINPDLEILKGVAPDDYKKYDLPYGTSSLELGDLSTGIEYFVRIATITESGLNMFTDASSLAPVKAPGILNYVNLRPITDSLVQVRFTDDVDNGGSALTHFVVDWDTNSNFATADFQTVQVAASNRVQKITTSAVTAPISGSFRLSLGDYHGDFTVRLGGEETFVEIRNGDSYLSRSLGTAALYSQIARGDFIRVVGQDFRICLNPHIGGLYDAETLPLCTVADAFVPAVFEFNCVLENQSPCTSGGVANVPVWKLDTSVGAAFDIRLGDNFIKTQGNPTIASLDDTSGLINSDFPLQGVEVGDFIRIGHPWEGQIMRVNGDTFSNQWVTLGAVSDADEAASITSTSLLSGGVTREVQMLTITTSDVNAASDLEAGTLSLGFGEESTRCISYNVTTEEMKEALEELDAVEEVEVSKSTLLSDGTTTFNGFEYKITFIGNRNTGNQPPIMAIVQPDNVDVQLDVQEDNSCGCANFESSTNDATDAVNIEVQTVEFAFAPVYKMQTTADIPFDASSEDMKAALEELSLVCTVDVSRSTNRHGYEWIVEFSSHKEDDVLGGALLLPLVPSHTDLHAVQVPDAVVLNMYIVDLPAPKAGVPFYARVAAVNAAGLGTTSISSPSSVQPSNQLPGRPADVKIQTVSPTELLVEWEMPSLNGGLPVHSYKVEWDSHDAFAHCSACTETVFSTTIESIPDVQLITTSVEPSAAPLDIYIGGSFTLLFDGQKTRQIPWDASAEEMEAALEELCTVDTISVSRTLGPEMKTNPGTPGADLWSGPGLDRGYGWLVTFTKMDYAGSQFNDYNSELEYTMSHKLSIFDSHLLSCDTADRSDCANDGLVSISIGNKQEEQQIFCDSDVSSTFQVTFMGYSTGYIESSGGSAEDVENDVKAALESLPSVGRVSVSTTQATFCATGGDLTGISVTFETELGDLPPMSISVRSGSA
jgi:hypothetical protein